MENNYYKTLGIDKNASEEEIKKAYRKMAHLYHPDRPGGNEEKFKKINEAYQILSNKQKREQYDRFGQTFDGAGGFGSPFSQSRSRTFTEEDLRKGFSSFGFEDFGGTEDLFENIFSGFGFTRERPSQKRGSDITAKINIMLEEAFFGKKETIFYDAQSICEECGGGQAGRGGRCRGYLSFAQARWYCEECGGAGAKNKSDIITCSECGGKGKIKETKATFFGAFSNIVECRKCQGGGKIAKNPCALCRGKGLINKEKRLDIDIKPGIKNEQIIKIIGAGNAGEKNAKAGDLFIVILIKPHHIFKRDGDDLCLKKTINIAQAGLGDKIEIPLIEGKTAEIEIPAGISSGSILRIKSKGMPKFSSFGRGNLLIEIEIKTPTKLSKKAKELLEELKKELS